MHRVHEYPAIPYLFVNKSMLHTTVTVTVATITAAATRFLKEWGIDGTNTTRGGLTEAAHDDGKHREIWLCQRKKGALGKGLGKTTGWIHRTK
jgi:hypothetical protein